MCFRRESVGRGRTRQNPEDHVRRRRQRSLAGEPGRWVRSEDACCARRCKMDSRCTGCENVEANSDTGEAVVAWPVGTRAHAREESGGAAQGWRQTAGGSTRPEASECMAPEPEGAVWVLVSRVDAHGMSVV